MKLSAAAVALVLLVCAACTSRMISDAGQSEAPKREKPDSVAVQVPAGKFIEKPLPVE